jgi:hypothetical protein
LPEEVLILIRIKGMGHNPTGLGMPKDQVKDFLGKRRFVIDALMQDEREILGITDLLQREKVG